MNCVRPQMLTPVPLPQFGNLILQASRRAPLACCTGFDRDRCGSADSYMWIWCGDTDLRTIGTCRAWHICRITVAAIDVPDPNRSIISRRMMSGHYVLKDLP